MFWSDLTVWNIMGPVGAMLQASGTAHTFVCTCVLCACSTDMCILHTCACLSKCAAHTCWKHASHVNVPTWVICACLHVYSEGLHVRV